MAIDKCEYTFKELSSNVLKKYYKILNTSLGTSIKISNFKEHKTSSKALLKKLGLEKDFPGCYVFLSGKKPFYIGISRHVISRICNHLHGKTHYSATLAYKIAKKNYCINENNKSKRKDLMKDQGFLKKFEEAKKHLSKSQVVFIEIDNPLERYLFEVYAAMEFNTEKYNTFDTH